MTKAKSIVIFSYHYLCSKNKAGFHFIAQELAKMGHEVTFVSTPYGTINYNKFKSKGGKFAELNTLTRVNNKLSSFVLFSLLPLISYRNKLLDILLQPLLVLQYKLLLKFTIKKYIKNADIIVFESNQFLRLFDYIQSQNKAAKYVYRVSDLMWCLPNFPQWAINYENTILNKFDVISVPSSYMFEYYTPLIKSKTILQLDYHGIDKQIFDQNNDPSPYDDDKINLIWVGVSSFDIDFIRTAAKLKPDWLFHIIGILEPISMPNVIEYGVILFKDTIKYIKHADIALACRIYELGVESLSNSLKVIQYSYCALPILAPQFMHYYAGNNMFYYIQNDEKSIAECLKMVENLKIDKLNYEILDWKETTYKIFAQII